MAELNAISTGTQAYVQAGQVYTAHSIGVTVEKGSRTENRLGGLQKALIIEEYDKVGWNSHTRKLVWFILHEGEVLCGRGKGFGPRIDLEGH